MIIDQWSHRSHLIESTTRWLIVDQLSISRKSKLFTYQWLSVDRSRKPTRSPAYWGGPNAQIPWAPSKLCCPSVALLPCNLLACRTIALPTTGIAAATNSTIAHSLPLPAIFSVATVRGPNALEFFLSSVSLSEFVHMTSKAAKARSATTTPTMEVVAMASRTTAMVPYITASFLFPLNGSEGRGKD